jgi:hypothetical protein
MKAIRSHIIIALLFAIAVVTSAMAENMKTLGSLDVHYMAIGATFLTPEIAKAYGIERSRFNGLVNISVLDNSKKGKPAIEVDISGTARNDLGQIKRLEFKLVKEGGAIYYLAQLNYTNEETFHFDIKLNDGQSEQQLMFKQKFYVD